MKITYIADAPVPSSAANCVQMLQMNSALAAAGHQVTLLARWHSQRARGTAGARRMCADYAVHANFSIHYLPFVRVRQRLGGSYFWVAAAAARALKPDLVITRTARIASACEKLGLRVLLELHTPPDSEAGWRNIRQLARSASVLRWVFISERLRQIFSNQVELPARKVLVAHDAVDLARFRPALNRDDARAQLGTPPGPLVVYAGSLYQGRGGEQLVEAAASLPSVRFCLVGGQAIDVERIRRYAAQRGAGNVELVGHVPPTRLPAYLYAADALVIPTTREGLAIDRRTVHVDYSSPMKLFEYMAAGRPIIATRLSGLAEVVQHERDALLVEPGDSEQLKEAIRRVLSDDSLARRLGRAASDAVVAHSWEARVEAMLAALGGERAA
jgi:glycosyltransferase involved in cell wall biosynthesis